MNTRGISVAVGANLGPLAQNFGTALSQADRFQRQLSAKVNSVKAGGAAGQVAKIGESLGKISMPGQGMIGGGGAESMADSLLPLAASIGSAFQKSIAPLASVAARIGGSFEKVGGTIVTLARRIDENMKFPKFQAWITGARSKVQEFAASSEGRISKFAMGVDKSLGAISGINKLRHLFVNIGDVAGRSLGKLRGMKGPEVNFNSSTRSITNFYGATTAATNGLKGFASQALVALGVFGLGYKAVGWFKEGITGAMNLGETLSKTKEVFGASTDAITGQADEMAKKFGISKQVSLDAASSFGLIGKAAGLSGPATTTLANDFTKLAGDVSSFYNIPIDQALEKMRSGLVGEAEPMRALGVLLSEGAVQQEAWRSGIAKAGEELTDQQKVQARAALITKGLATASGDLERTQASASNQARQFTGSMGNLATEVGTLFLPALTRGLGLLNEFGSYLGRVFAENRGTIEGWGQSITAVFDFVGTAFANLPLVLEIGGLVIAQSVLNIGEHFDALGQNVTMIAKFIGDHWYQFIETAMNATVTLLKNYAKNVWAVAGAIKDFLADPTQGFSVEWTPMLDGFKSTVAQLPELIKPTLTDLSGEIGAKMSQFDAALGQRRSAGGTGTADAPARGTLMTPGSGESQSIKDLKELVTFADKLKEDIKTPLEKYTEGLTKLTKARDQGLITADQFERGKTEVAKDAGINKDPKFAGAVELGSKEAYSSVAGAISGRSSGMQNMEKSTQQTAANTASSAASLKLLAANFNSVVQTQFAIPR